MPESSSEDYSVRSEYRGGFDPKTYSDTNDNDRAGNLETEDNKNAKARLVMKGEMIKKAQQQAEKDRSPSAQTKATNPNDGIRYQWKNSALQKRVGTLKVRDRRGDRSLNLYNGQLIRSAGMGDASLDYIMDKSIRDLDDVSRLNCDGTEPEDKDNPDIFAKKEEILARFLSDDPSDSDYVMTEPDGPYDLSSSQIKHHLRRAGQPEVSRNHDIISQKVGSINGSIDRFLEQTEEDRDISDPVLSDPESRDDVIFEFAKDICNFTDNGVADAGSVLNPAQDTDNQGFDLDSNQGSDRLQYNKLINEGDKNGA